MEGDRGTEALEVTEVALCENPVEDMGAEVGG